MTMMCPDGTQMVNPEILKGFILKVKPKIEKKVMRAVRTQPIKEGEGVAG